ncbi:MAG: hypothetical protein Kow0092_09720 [Deferrisomatales bacterium]
MTDRKAAGPERELLRLEEAAAEEFVERLRALMGARHVLVFAPSGGAGAQELRLCTPLPAPIGPQVAALSLAPREDPRLSGLDGRLSVVAGDLSEIPGAELFPEARWGAVGVGPARGFCLLAFGTQSPPPFLARDELVGRALLRRVARRIEAEGSPGALAAEALVRLSHEFKTPLVSIKGYAELILDAADEPISPRVRDWVRRIAGGANRLAALFRKATSEARTEAPWVFEARPTAVEPWVRWCVDEASALAAARKLSWEWQVEPGLAPVGLDPEAGRDLLLELLQNAARATPDGGTVRVSARGVARHGRSGVQLTVEDTGVGVPEGRAAVEIFDRFATLGDSLEHHSGDFEFGAGGLGLGLALVRGVARAHGGEAWAEGRGRDPLGLPGCAVHVWLPLAEGEGRPAAGLPWGGKGRILVVEPDPEAAQILQTALGELHEVVVAADAPRAMALWREAGPWEGCIVEPRGPDAGAGADLLRALRGSHGAEQTPILVYTTASSPGEAAVWRAAGADACVAKPARTRALLQRLRAVRNRRNRR